MINFQGRHFPKDLILMAVRWKLAYPLSYRNIEELMYERGTDVDHSTVQKWVYLYRAVDKEGNTIYFMLSETRDRPAVLKFFKKAIGSSGLPQKVNIDKSGSNTAALERINNLLFMFGLWHFPVWKQFYELAT